MKHLGFIAYLMLILFLMSLFTGMARGDGGIISPYHVYEYAQSAVIAWDNDKEYLVLQVGLDAGFSQEVDEIKALRVIPFPSLPKVVSSKDITFDNIVELMREKDRKMIMQNVENSSFYGGAAGGGFAKPPSWSNVIYYGSVTIGAHTVGLFKILTVGNMKEKVDKAFSDMGINYELQLDSYGNDILNKYIENGYNYFAFDFITIRKDDGSYQKVEPVGFIFNSSSIYYPVEITFLSPGNYGYSTIALYVITPYGVNVHSTKLGDFQWKKRYRVSYDDLKKLDDKNILSILSSGYLDVFLGESLTRGTKSWNFEGKPNSMDPYLVDMLPFFIVFPVIPLISLLSLSKKLKIKRKSSWDVLFFGAIVILIMIVLYLASMHYFQIGKVWMRYSSTPSASEIYSYYLTELYMVLFLSLVFLLLSFRIKEKLAVLITALSAIWGITIALQYMGYLTLNPEMFGITLAFFLILMVPYEMRKGFNTSGESFQKRLSLAVGIPLFIFAFFPSFQVVDMGFYTLFIGLSYLQNDVEFGNLNKEKNNK